MPNLAGTNLFVECLQGFFQRSEVLVLVAIAQLAEEVGAAFRPVQLVQVHPIGAQALEAGIQGGHDVLAVQARLAVADMRDAIATGGDLGGQDPVLPVFALGEPVADDGFGAGVGFGARRYRVHLCGVDEIDAGSTGEVDLGEGFGFAVLLAPGHAAKAQGADLQVGAAERTIFHADLLID
ncbi:MAG: hypothetical protein GAK36_00245 [Pseudomonas sp.]|nr:MAG: hypothetical protein GAK36_00245 [Pseudomonas sp.]